MDHFVGEQVQTGSALASASRVLEAYGLTSLPPVRLARVALSIERDPIVPPEIEDVILVARKAPLALLNHETAGYRIVGLALAGYPDEDFRPGVPCVCGLGDEFLSAVSEYELVLIDANSGSVYLQPDAMLVSQFQATPRRPSIYLSEAHLPAKTASDNRFVSVYTYVRSHEDIETALECGADGLCVCEISPLLTGSSGSSTSAGQRRALDKLAEYVSGIPLLIDVPIDGLALSAVRAAAHGAEIEIAVNGRTELDYVVADFEMTKLVMQVTDMADPVRLNVAISTECAEPELDAMENASGFVLREVAARYSGAVLLPLFSYARHLHKTITVYLPAAEWAQDLEDAIGFGVTRVVCDPSAIRDVKDSVREL